MSVADTIESYLLRCELSYEQIDPTTWAIGTDAERKKRLMLRVQEPIALASAPILEIDDNTEDKEGLFRCLLKLNAELMACSYGLHDGHVVLSGAHQTENFDINEFQALIDDLMLALDTHGDALRAWLPAA